MTNNETRNLGRLKILLRVYGVVTLIIFGSLLLGFGLQTPLLADEPRGALNWTIWNGIRCGNEPCFVPPMLFIIHIVWGVFFFMAVRKPLSYISFLSFTMWAYLAHGLLMTGQALTHFSTQWTGSSWTFRMSLFSPWAFICGDPGNVRTQWPLIS